MEPFWSNPSVLQNRPTWGLSQLFRDKYMSINYLKIAPFSFFFLWLEKFSIQSPKTQQKPRVLGVLQNSLALQLKEMCSEVFTLAHPYCTGGPRLGHSTPDAALQGQSRWRQSPPSPCCHPSSDADKTAGLLGCKHTLLAHVKLFIHLNPQILLCRALSVLIRQSHETGLSKIHDLIT